MRARREMRAAAPAVYGFVSRKTRNCLSVRRMWSTSTSSQRPPAALPPESAAPADLTHVWASGVTRRASRRTPIAHASRPNSGAARAAHGARLGAPASMRRRPGPPAVARPSVARAPLAPPAPALADSVVSAASAQTGTCVNLQCQQDNCTRGACTQHTVPERRQDDGQRHRLRPRGQDAALQRRRLRPQRAAGGYPRPARRATPVHRRIRGGRSPRRSPIRSGHVLARAHAGGRQHPAGHPDWQVAARRHGAVRGGVQPTHPWRGADAPAAQQERGAHPEDCDRERRLGRAQLPAQARLASTPPSSPPSPPPAA